MANILVVDDEIDMCSLIQAILEAAGHRVMSTKDPRSVPALMEEQPYDLVIADMVMPHLGGVEVVRGLRHDYPAVGIVAMSGAMPRQRIPFFEAGRKFGADATIDKPFRKEEVLASISLALKQATHRRAAAG